MGGRQADLARPARHNGSMLCFMWLLWHLHVLHGHRHRSEARQEAHATGMSLV